MKTSYVVIGFGQNDHGFYNHKAFCGTIGYATGFYNAHLHDPEMDGAVIIRETDNTWEVILEFGTEGMSISCDNYGVFNINKAPTLVMV